MKFWDELVTTALVGTERQSPPPAEVGTVLGDALADLESWEPERRLLASAGATALYRRAGTKAQRDDSPLPVPAEPETQPVCSDRAAQHLEMMLGGTHGTVLEEWLAAAARRGLRVPPQVLPELLQAGRQSRALREPILEVAGKRGRWLATQNPEWSYLAIEGEEEASWETGSRAARQMVFGRMRAADPARARERLQQTWSQEPADDRCAFLSAFRQGLSAEDEHFLEAALDDRSKTVRAAAADLLARLPGSAFRARMRERVLPLVSARSTSGMLGIGRKLQVLVSLPSECDASLVRDGVEAKLPQSEKELGEKAWWLFQMLGAVPPEAWAEMASARPADLVEAAAKTEWHQLLVRAWSTAAERSGDEDWAEAILLQPGKWSDAHEPLMEVLPPARRETVALTLLGRGADVLDGQHPAMRALGHCRHGWSDLLSRAVLAQCRQRVTRGTAFDWPLHEALPRFGLHISPKLANEAAGGWTVPENLQSYWSGPIDRLTSVLNFRREMLEEIHQ